MKSKVYNAFYNEHNRICIDKKAPGHIQPLIERYQLKAYRNIEENTMIEIAGNI